MPEEVAHQMTCSVSIYAMSRAVGSEDETHQTHKAVFPMDQVCLNVDGSMQVTFFGIKNDMNSSGSVVFLPPNWILYVWSRQLQATKLFRL